MEIMEKYEMGCFNFQQNEIRTTMINGEAWFVAKDVCDILEIRNTTQALAKLDEDERSMLNIGRQGEMNIVNEFGLYNLVLSSRKPEAKQFKRWITHEVIPSIRKTGGYQVPNDPMSALKLMFAATEQIDEEVKEVKNRVFDLEENVSLSAGEYGYIAKRVTQKVFQIGRERSYNMNKKQKTELFRALNSEIAAITGVKTRTQLKKKQFDLVVDFIDDWEPSKATTVVVKQLELEV